VSEKTTLTMTRSWTCPDCGKSYTVGNVIDADSCCGRAVMKPVTYKDRVQVTVVGAKRDYTYLKGVLDLKVGDLVEVPLRTMNVLGTVSAVESEYAGVCRSVIRRVPVERTIEKEPTK